MGSTSLYLAALNFRNMAVDRGEDVGSREADGNRLLRRSPETPPASGRTGESVADKDMVNSQISSHI